MRLGVVLWADRDVSGLARLAVAAERAGFDDVWWPDHYMHRDIGATLTACALATERVRIGSAVTSPLLRHPGALASLFASLAEVAPGRVVAGLGPGGWELPTQLGIREPKPLTATRHAVEVLRTLLRGERCTVAQAAATTAETGGHRFPVADAGLDFTPPEPVPIYLAARGPRMMSLAGETADGLITHSLSLPFLNRVIEQTNKGLRKAQRPQGSCEIAVWLEVQLDDDLTAARDTLRRRCLYMVGGEYSPEMIPLYGLDPDEVMPVRAAVRARDPKAHELITDEMVDAFSISGSVERAADRIAELERAGAHQLILSLGHGVSEADIEAVGAAVTSALRPHRRSP